MSPLLPPALPVSVGNSVGNSVPVSAVPSVSVPVSPSQRQTYIQSALPVSVVSSRFSDSSLSVLQQFQRHTLRAPVLRHFALSYFRVWHQQFVQFMTRAGAEFATAIQ